MAEDEASRDARGEAAEWRRPPWRTGSSASKRVAPRGMDADALGGAMIDGDKHRDLAFGAAPRPHRNGALILGSVRR